MAPKRKRDTTSETTSEDVGKKPKHDLSGIKNKILRTQLYRKQKHDQHKLKRKERKQKRKEAEELGDMAPPKQIPKTIENQRVADETMVAQEDEEVAFDLDHDEMSSYFNRETTPKVFITTSGIHCSKRTRSFLNEFQQCVPNSEVVKRGKMTVKKIIEMAKEQEFTDVLVFNEDRNRINGLICSHLPNGPTAHFKISNLVLRGDSKHFGKPTSHRPEVILNNFNTRLGHTIGRLLGSLFHHDPNFHGRRVVTFHNQRDFIFFRQHRYQFRNNEKAGLHELAPSFTMKLRSLQKGTFDAKHGEYEWVHKRHEMETSRRKFYL